MYISFRDSNEIEYKGNTIKSLQKLKSDLIQYNNHNHTEHLVKIKIQDENGELQNLERTDNELRLEGYNKDKATQNEDVSAIP